MILHSLGCQLHFCIQLVKVIYFKFIVGMVTSMDAQHKSVRSLYEEFSDLLSRPFMIPRNKGDICKEAVLIHDP